MHAGCNAPTPAGCHAQDMSLRCVIVDDNVAFLRSAAAALRQEGVDVVEFARSVVEALAHASTYRPDVMLVDIELGDDDGFDIAAQLDGDAVPVVLISTYGESDMAELVAASPAIGFLSKLELSRAAIEGLLADAADGPRPG